MRKNRWKAVAIAAVLMMTVPALLALAADKAAKTKPVGKTAEQSMPGCSMHGGAGMDVAAGMPGCGMKGSAGKAGCCMHGDMKGCGMKGDMGKGMPGCGMKGEMGRGMAGGPMCGPGMGPGMGAGHGAMMLKELDLTAAQEKKVEALHEKQARLMVQNQADIRIATMDLQQLMRAESPDKAKIDAQIDKLAQLRAGMQKSRTATLLEVRALLTPEQLKKFHAGPMGDEEEDD